MTPLQFMDYKGFMKLAPMPKGEMIKSYEGGLIRLYLTSKGKAQQFAVCYGLQIDEGLSYGAACAKLGQAILHDASCDGLLD